MSMRSPVTYRCEAVMDSGRQFLSHGHADLGADQLGGLGMAQTVYEGTGHGLGGGVGTCAGAVGVWLQGPLVISDHDQLAGYVVM